MFHPAAVASTSIWLGGDVPGVVERILKGEPRSEVANQQFLLCGHVLARDPDESSLRIQQDSLSILDDMVKRTGSQLPEAVYHNHVSSTLLLAGQVDEGTAAARRTIEAATSIGLTLFIGFGAINLARASDAAG